VCGEDWCILIDAPQYFDEADELKEAALKDTGGDVKLAVITHGHLDHTATLQAFPGITVIATSAAREYMLGKGQHELDKMKQDDEELRNIRLIIPSVTFVSEGAVYDDVGRNLRCIPAPGHSNDSQIVFLESERIIFSGDTLSSVVPPFFPDGNSMQLQQSITELVNLNAQILVPGHGPLMHGEEIAHEAGKAVQYLENLRHQVREGVDNGESVETLQEKIEWDSCTDKPAPPEEYMKYHQENIANMAKEITEELRALEAAWHV
jgi:cyclase